VDKVLTLRGGAELVAFWAQLGSVVELVAGVALAGVGTGISVLVAQAGAPDRQRELLGESLKLGLAVSAPVMFAVAAVRDPVLIFSLTFVAQFLIFINTGPLNAAICNCVAPAFRSFAMGLNVLFLHLLGDALSPTVIGALGKRFSLGTAIQVNAIPVLAGGLVLLLGTKYLAKENAPASFQVP